MNEELQLHTLGKIESNGSEQQEDKAYKVEDETASAKVIRPLQFSVMTCHDPADYSRCEWHCV